MARSDGMLLLLRYLETMEQTLNLYICHLQLLRRHSISVPVTWRLECLQISNTCTLKVILFYDLAGTFEVS